MFVTIPSCDWSVTILSSDWSIVLILICDWLQVRRLTEPRMLEEGVTISLPDYSEQEIRQGLAVTRDTGR